MKRVRRFKCKKCGKVVVTTERKPGECCSPNTEWIPGNLVSEEYKMLRTGWRRKQPKVKMTKKERRRARALYKEAMNG